MATVTIRKLPDDLLERIRTAAEAHGRSLEQELRETLASRYPTRDEVLGRIRARWDTLPAAAVEEIDEAIERGRE
jgi:plasmid stability protein